MAPTSPPCADDGTELVRATGATLCLRGEPFRFLGANRYDLLSSERFTCGRRYDDAELDRICAELAATGLRVVRTWAFPSFTATDDWSSLDRLIAAARRHDLRLILTLENEWQDCSTPDPASTDGRKGQAWFADGWRTSLLPHLRAIVSRYRDEPRILAWQIMNEAECPDAATLRAFADEASAEIKAIDQEHLVSLGTIGTGQAGTVGDDYRTLHEVGGVDLVEAHDYHEPLEALPGRISDDLAVARAIGKPFFIGEAGISAPAPAYDVSYEERARAFAAKIRAAFDAGVSGYLLWSFYDLRSPTQGWDFAPDDPLAAMLRTFTP